MVDLPPNIIGPAMHAFFHVFVQNGYLTGAASGIRESFRLYPLIQTANPPERVFVNVSGKRFYSIHAKDFHFYDELNEVVRY